MELGRAVWVADPAFARRFGCVDKGKGGRERGRNGREEAVLSLHVACTCGEILSLRKPHVVIHSPIRPLSCPLFLSLSGATPPPAIAYLWKAVVG